MDRQASPAPSADLTVDFRFEISRISILALIRPAFSSDLKRLINSTQFPAHYGATNLINLARKSILAPYKSFPISACNFRTLSLTMEFI
ncbi:hypothetical protein G6K93_33190 [Agrobacterium rhizogenes]|uniref:hypothetical protein n=1 Tax=Rhizobium rhizogenes TaxID=359 RepID=UPI001572C9EA|nr:hypothetical protein [Rhizobium rhizogenes]NTF52960.1 hypothetical protein [Rhizobium rhizogenes]NTH10170.1 hypothetical protein [Rhizobium rhizogenes]NTH42722.1 hypothetical protein [Rhizobium rhizogenes]NTI06729.1 hypothetical protein [Rhizobium rhizogenes]NTI13534.1 hypothetical protein [Rhizobium rhizogenes]